MEPETSIHTEFYWEMRLHKELVESLQEAESIIIDLCKQDSRFRFLEESISMFKFDELDLLYTFGKYLRARAAQNNPPERLSKDLEEIRSGHRHSAHALFQIVRSAIYEILNVLHINISRDQVPASYDIPTHIRLLRSLEEKCNKPCYPCDKKSKKIERQPFIPQDHGIVRKPEDCVLQYFHSSLRTTDGNILPDRVRILHILPGPEGSPIECSLEVRDLSTEGIAEALSYVWGRSQVPKFINVDGCSFKVTENLFNILSSLRDRHNKREIWIDAICINQSDSDEKVHQVRLMRDIYSKAKKTTIWLSGRTLEEQLAQNSQLGISNSPDDVLAPLPRNFMGNTIDQYDLVGILEEFHRSILVLRSANEAGKKGWALITMFIHCINVIMSQEWWERVWTIQEAALPPEHPCILFQGHTFSFGDLTAALTTLHALPGFAFDGPSEFIDKADDLPSDTRFLLLAYRQQMAYWIGRRREPVLQHLRPGQEKTYDWEIPTDRSLDALLCETDRYRATNPRDKIFALESLLPNSLGRLIYVDYNESVEDVFRRVTARCYNSSVVTQVMSTRFKLLIESKPSSSDVPSWVHDFEYSDATLRQDRDVQKVTLGGYLSDRRNWQPACKDLNKDSKAPTTTSCFATPTILFCSGVEIDVICRTGIIPDFSGPDWTDKLIEFTFDILEGHPNKILGMMEHMIYLQKERPELFEEGHMIQEGGLSPDLNPSDDYKDVSTQTQQDYKNYYSNILPVQVFDLFTLKHSDRPGRLLRKARPFLDEESADREFEFRELAGKEFFITDGWLIGIATAPNIKEGDKLCLFHMSPVYYILREAEHQVGKAQAVQQHRIVSRAAVNESQDQMEERIEKLPSRDFQIV
ncbi:heterokaryon incompatibility protein-domain-containing protein [Daldinia vernicosa]|uniref:heterokaryon incompatibility protein-domain-containing protein n=1 Tax=Daldinia vernicosa TaxID=114800 RepID=UPI0020089E9C|nr:heterokaryon incompatibility protein-domain-containing protein [Daldinia vernicosa]KAI0848921.1 heterokaryon incompatibility protein-domain-containing protein [Daldinia vernicosa]